MDKLCGALMKTRVAIAFMALAVSAGAQAGVFKCVDAAGAVTFSGVPCADGAQVERIEVPDNHIGGQFSTYEQQRSRAEQRAARAEARAQAERNRPRTVCRHFSDTELRTLRMREQVKVGMKMSDVHRSWGRPSRILGNLHAWHYDGARSQYVFEEDGCAAKVE